MTLIKHEKEINLQKYTFWRGVLSKAKCVYVSIIRKCIIFESTPSFFKLFIIYQDVFHAFSVLAYPHTIFYFCFHDFIATDFIQSRNVSIFQFSFSDIGGVVRRKKCRRCMCHRNAHDPIYLERT